MEVGGKLVCKNCAQNLANRQVSAPSAANKKEPFLALILSFLIPGLGQLYNGDLTKGIFLFLGAIVSVVLMFVCIGFLTYLAIWIYGMYDAYIYAEKINRGEVKY
jgi:TM2 domain-containing membrane protein YozV